MSESETTIEEIKKNMEKIIDLLSAINEEMGNLEVMVEENEELLTEEEVQMKMDKACKECRRIHELDGKYGEDE